MEERKHSGAKAFTLMLGLIGVVALAYSLYKLYVDSVQLDLFLLLLFMINALLAIEMTLPGTQIKLAMTGPLVYLGTILMGPWAGMVLGSAHGLANSLLKAKRLSRPLATATINATSIGFAALSASLLAGAIAGPTKDLLLDNSRFNELILVLGVMAAVSFAVNTAISAIGLGLWSGRSPLKIWLEDQLWTCYAFFLGAASGGFLAKAIATFGPYWFVASALMLLLARMTYGIYFGKIERSRGEIEKLTKLYLATIESLAIIIDARDQASPSRILQVRAMAERLARAVGYPEDQIEGLKAAALLRDIGKLAVPEYILNKAGHLSPAEFSKVAIHPTVGASILSSIEFPYEVVPIVKHHHERYDGTGYPSGLRGDEIPLGARILAIVDCYCALTSDRPHRKRYTHEQAMEIMKQEAGRAFDPNLLEKFFQVVDQVPAEHPLHGPLNSELAAGPALISEEALRDIVAAKQEALSLYDISQMLNSALSLSDVLEIVSTKLKSLTNITTLVIYILEGDQIVAAHAAGKNAQRIKGLRIRLGEGEAGWAAEHCETLIVNSQPRDLIGRLGPAASSYSWIAAFPLIKSGSLVGVIALYSEEPRGYSADEMRLLNTIGGHAAAAIYNALRFERTKESALTDGLTGLPNPRYLYSFFDQERSRAERYGYPIVLMMMDLDGFKQINDNFGHQIGNEVLRHIAQIIRGRLRSGDILCRYAGDEFIALLHQATPDSIRELKRRLQFAVDNFTYEVRPGQIAQVGLSIGHATFGEDGHSLEELIEAADRRMYQNKASRKRMAASINESPHASD
jgi:diguanylate cyclase (GGDEF)-like protein/putative nucleotidyltransferase with HDIG domain